MPQGKFSYKLPVVITKQGHQFVAYSPALDISTVGNSKRNVQKRFEELVSLFLEELAQAGTMYDVLTELGWKQVKKVWNPPQVVSTNTIAVKMPAYA